MAFGRRTQPSGHDPATTDQPPDGINLPMTVPEVANVLRTSRKAIYAMIARRQLPGVIRINRRVLMDRKALLDWLSQKSTPHREGER